MIGPDEVLDWATRLGVSAESIRRDHLLSHVLLAVKEIADEQVIFYGGSALARTHLDGARLSEDVDLETEDASTLADALGRELPRRLRREFPDLTWNPSRSARGVRSAFLRSPEGRNLRIQIAGVDRGLPTERHDVRLWYSDLPEAIDLTLPTLPAFAAMKIGAYLDRAAPRDLFDLAELVAKDALTPDAVHLLRSVYGQYAVPQGFSEVPTKSRDAWESELAHQVRELPAPDDCLRRVREALASTVWKPEEP